jgi:hypothetical protein
MPPGRPIALRAEDVGRGDPGIWLARAALATIQCARDSRVPVVELARKTWPNDRAPEILLRAPSQVASTATPAWPGVLAQTAVAFINSLTPLSAGADLLQRCLQLSFGGARKIFVPGIFPVA